MSEGPSRDITLDYQRQPVARAVMPRWMRVCFAVGAVPGVVVPWLLFALDTSPWMVVRAFLEPGFYHYDSVLLALAAPYFLALPIFTGKARLAIAGKSRLWEQVTAWTAGGLAAAATCGVLVYMAGGPTPELLPMLAGALAVLGAGTAAAVWLLRMRARAESLATLAVYVPYLANGTLCLWVFRNDDRETGWYVALGVCLIMVIELVWTVVWEIGNKVHILEP